ncbi:MAG: primosomal protein N' [Cycloclasticus sp. symbiont of Poecilosclerida sp. N]|nr:MAG: primosomal protein N' [Cycloclasticus sp. symbiont of Poecilosclerida sp. N]
MSRFYLNIAVDTPLHIVFDYLPLAQSEPSDYAPGQRVIVPFGRQQKTGVILGLSSETSLSKKQLKPIAQHLDKDPLLCEQDITLYKWASDYYHHPIGEVFSQVLPKQVRAGKPLCIEMQKLYAVSAVGHEVEESSLKRSPRQLALLQLIKSADKPTDKSLFDHLEWDWRGPLKKLTEKAWVTVSQEQALPCHKASAPNFQPNPEQQAAIDAIIQSQGSFQTFLLDGITGSGKTEVYLQLIQRLIAEGKQVLILLPEITLTPQLANRFKQRLAAQMVISHSKLNDSRRAQAWLRLKEGFANILLGTRSAVFTPMKNPGMIILDEEHDTSFKQQQGFRYSARDVAIMRARNYKIPIVLGTATPSLESLHNVQQGRFTHLVLPKRTAGAVQPSIKLIDCKNQRLDNHLSDNLIKAITKTLGRGEQVILFVNRRGFAPVLMCHSCGWVCQCLRCDSRMVIHKNTYLHSPSTSLTRGHYGSKQKASTSVASGLLRCHHCGAERRVPANCPDCQQAELFPLGIGTERIEETLSAHFPNIPITRIDRDSTQRKDAMQAVIDKVHEGGAQILVGTQMLAKGHHFPNVTLVGMVDIDAGLFSCDFRASERTSQLITQVAGRAGREKKKGLVLIQTHHPQHPLLTTLISHGYESFAKDALKEREQAQLPPYHYHALLRVNAMDEQAVLSFLNKVKQLISTIDTRQVNILGPVPAPMLKRAGRFRYQLLIEASQRKTRHHFLKTLLPAVEKLKLARKTRWSIDIDPVDLY